MKARNSDDITMDKVVVSSWESNFWNPRVSVSGPNSNGFAFNNGGKRSAAASPRQSLIPLQTERWLQVARWMAEFDWVARKLAYHFTQPNPHVMVQQP